MPRKPGILRSFSCDDEAAIPTLLKSGLTKVVPEITP